MLRECRAADLECGDKIIVKNHEVLIKSIEGPDTVGAYDISAIDTNGQQYYEPIYGIVSIVS